MCYSLSVDEITRKFTNSANPRKPLPKKDPSKGLQLRVVCGDGVPLERPSAVETQVAQVLALRDAIDGGMISDRVISSLDPEIKKQALELNSVKLRASRGIENTLRSSHGVVKDWLNG